MQLSSSDKVLYLKIVYYGPGLSGKTTNLETIHRLTDPGKKQPMVSLRTEQDRTLFFDLLPFDLGKLYGLDIRIKLYTVPGQIQYDTTRKQVLAGADAVVFVADSQRAQAGENGRMVKYLKNNLEANGLDPEAIPLLFQWNKRDLDDILPPEEMSAQLNWRGVPELEAVATVGNGVIETFREISLATLEGVALQGRGGGGPAALKAMREKVTAQLAPFEYHGDPPGGDGGGPKIGHVHQQAARVERSEGPDRHRNVLGLDDLLSEAVQANLAISEQLAVASGAEEAVSSRLQRERKALSRLLQILQVSSDPAGVLKIALSTLVAGVDARAGSVMASGGAGQPCHELAVAGVKADPLNSIRNPGVGSVAAALVDRKEPLICHDIAGELLFGQGHPAAEAYRAVMALPVAAGSGRATAILLYAHQQRREFGVEDQDFATLVCGIVALALRALRPATA